MPSVCFVCLGNICRSPTAEAVFTKLVSDAGLSDSFVIDSAGTSGYHEGELADPRSRAAAQRRGYEIPLSFPSFRRRGLRPIRSVCAMDEDNVRELRRLARTAEHESKVFLLRCFDSTAAKDAVVPDPYYGGSRGFDDVIDICERACRGLLKHLSQGTGR
ncbi:MAG: low molecular weight protein-tyrosine-phosphatase [Polyangiaceae bacterium]